MWKSHELLLFLYVIFALIPSLYIKTKLYIFGLSLEDIKSWLETYKRLRKWLFSAIFSYASLIIYSSLEWSFVTFSILKSTDRKWKKTFGIKPDFNYSVTRTKGPTGIYYCNCSCGLLCYYCNVWMSSGCKNLCKQMGGCGSENSPTNKWKHVCNHAGLYLQVQGGIAVNTFIEEQKKTKLEVGRRELE